MRPTHSEWSWKTPSEKKMTLKIVCKDYGDRTVINAVKLCDDK
jgi:hypothetical protein